MTYRAPAAEQPALERPPQIFGFALYLMGTGLLVMGVAQLLMFAMLHGTSQVPFLGLVVRWGMPVGQLMTALGLAIAWRTTKGAGRRLLAVAGALWATLFVLDFERVQVRSFMIAKHPSAAGLPYVATWAGWAIALSIVAVLVFRGARAFAARTWATVLGVALVTAHAFEQAWPILTPLSRPIPWSTSSMVPGLLALGALGLVVFAGGLLASGRNILRSVTVDEYVRAGSNRKSSNDKKSAASAGDDDRSDPSSAALLRGLPLFVDASVALSGLATALALAVGFASVLHLSARDLVDTAAAGGQLVASALLVLATRRLQRVGAAPLRCAVALLASLVVCLALLASARSLGWSWAHELLRFVNVVPSLLAGLTLWTTAKALHTFTIAEVEPLRGLRSRLRAAAVSLVAAGAGASLAANTADLGGRYALGVLAVTGGVMALASTLGAAAEARRIEVGLAASARERRACRR